MSFEFYKLYKIAQSVPFGKNFFHNISGTSIIITIEAMKNKKITKKFKADTNKHVINKKSKNVKEFPFIMELQACINIAKFFRTSFSLNTSGRLLLYNSDFVPVKKKEKGKRKKTCSKKLTYHTLKSYIRSYAGVWKIEQWQFFIYRFP